MGVCGRFLSGDHPGYIRKKWPHCSDSLKFEIAAAIHIFDPHTQVIMLTYFSKKELKKMYKNKFFEFLILSIMLPICHSAVFWKIQDLKPGMNYLN